MTVSRLTVLSLALAAGFAVVAADVANARVGGGKNFGSRGSKTYTAPPATNTAPGAAPIERSMTQKGAPSATQSAQPGAAAAAQPSRFGGWRGLVMGGLLAAGFASIFGFGAMASMLGFLLQFALIAGAVYLIVMFFRSRNQPALASAAAGGTAKPNPGDTLNRQAFGLNGAVSTAPPVIGKDDFDSFERLLGDIQTAYGREDTDKLGAMTTPEMLSYFSQDLADNAKQGVRNEISEVKLLQGDLSEAWRDGGSEYATVAIRYTLVDTVVDRATGKLVSGDRDNPTEATELWTFRRDDRAPADGWQLSAIQQAA